MSRITERRIYAVPSTPLTSDGTQKGQLQVADSSAWMVGHIVHLTSDTQTTLELKIKRISPDKTTMWLGPKDKSIHFRTDISDFLIADNAAIKANEQERPSVPEQEVERATYEEEPAVARRVIIVDKWGCRVDEANPLPVQLSDGSIDIGTVNAELEVQLSHEDNVPDAGDVADSVQIGDGTEIVEVNPDGSINVVVVPGATGGGITVNTFGSVASVASSTPTTIVTYTAPVGKKAFLVRGTYGGGNIAVYDLELNGSPIDRKRTYWNGPMSDEFDFSAPNGGLPLAVGDVVRIRIEHFRTMLADFEGRIQVVEV